MAARDIESALLARCSAVARESVQEAQDQREANVFQLAATLVQSHFPAESQSLRQASERYFASHPNERLASAEIVRLKSTRRSSSHRIFSRSVHGHQLGRGGLCDAQE